jgi:hypothetical protein
MSKRAARATMLAMRYGLGVQQKREDEVYASIKNLGDKILVNRWQNSDNSCWLELYRQDVDGREAYCFSSYRGGGNMGYMPLKKATEDMNERLRAFHMDGDTLDGY